MFLVAPPETKAKILANLSVHPEKEAGQELRRHLHTLPETIMISKQRQYGVPLQSFGVDSKFVLDPKISLAMMGMFVRQHFPSQKLGAVVQGIDSLGNLAPYASIIDPDWPQYLTHGLIPRQEPDGITKKNPDFYFPFLALLSFSCPRDLASTQLQAFSTEFHRTTSQARFNLSTNCDPKLAPLNLFTDLQTRRGYQAVRKAIYDGQNPPPKVTKLLYGNIET